MGTPNVILVKALYFGILSLCTALWENRPKSTFKDAGDEETFDGVPACASFKNAAWFLTS
jgi:hypothetical protein